MEIVRPESVGLSSARLARIERHLERGYLDQKKIAGALTLVARRGQIAHLAPLGMRDLERGAPMQADTIFRIYSMSKPDRKSTRLNSSHLARSRMPSSA